MADLRVKIGRLELKNPIIVASSPLTAKLDLIKRAEENGATCVSIKHTMLKQQFIAKPRWFVNRNIGMMVSGDPRLPAEEAQELIRKVKEQTGVTVLVNMSASPEDITTWSTLAGKLAEARLRGLARSRRSAPPSQRFGRRSRQQAGTDRLDGAGSRAHL